MSIWQFSGYFAPILVSVVASAWLSVIVWRRRKYRYARSLLVLLSAVTWWSLTYLVGLGTTAPVVKRVAYSLSYPAIGLISIAWLVFAIQYTGRLRMPAKGEFAGLVVIPGVTTVAALTNQYHGLLWSSVEFASRGELEVMITSPGLLFWVHTLQSYALIGLGTGLILQMTLLSDAAYRAEGTALLLAATVPLVVNLLYLAGIVAPVDPTPAAFALSGTVLIAVTFRNQFLQSLPLARRFARDKLIRQMASPIIMVDRQARVVDINPAAESVAETRADIVGSKLGSTFPNVSDAVDLHSESRQRAEMITKSDGAKQHYEVEKLPLHHGGRKFRGHLIRMNDVTELRTHQRELVRERQFIDQALDALTDLFYVVDVDGSVRRWNRKFIEVTGYDDLDPGEMDAVEFFPDDDRAKVADAVGAVLQDGEGDVIEADILTADGERIPHELAGARLEDDDGDPAGLVGIGRNISDRKERERQLRTFRKAVENAGRMIYWMDGDGTVEYVNPTFEATVDADAATVVGERTFPLADWAGSEVSADSILSTLTRGEIWRAEFTIRRTDGKHRTIDQVIKPVFEDREITRFVAVAGDVTEARRRKQQVSVLQRILRHDLRNNLNEMLLSVQLARRESTNDAVRQQLAGADRTIHETLSLSQDVEQFKRAFESGTMDSEAVDIVEVVQEQVATLRAERSNVDFSKVPTGTAHVMTNGLIRRAVRNVLRNAVEHNDTDTPEVTAELVRRPETDEIELQISDNGPGVPNETVETLNSDREERLSHLDGFGLWLVNWVLTLSGGKVEIAENEPRGAIVKLVLPAARGVDHHHTDW